MTTGSSDPLQPGAPFVFSLMVMVPPYADIGSQDNNVVIVQSTYDSQVKPEAQVIIPVPHLTLPRKACILLSILYSQFSIFIPRR
jgi:hypothetical protein